MPATSHTLRVLSLFSCLFFIRNNSFAQSCNAVNGNAYFVTTQYDYGPGSLSQAINDANFDNVGGYIFSYVDTIFLSSPPPTVTVDSLSIFVFSGISIDCQFSVSDPVFTFAANAPHSCFSSYLNIYNAAPTTFTVTNTDDSGSGSLREAISFSEVSSSMDQISFNITGISPHTISPLSGYTVTKPLIIDGSTQPSNGYSGVSPKIIIDGGHLVSYCFFFDYVIDNNYGFKVYGCYMHGFTTAISSYFARNITIGAGNKRNVFNDDTIGVVLQECRNITIDGNYFGTDTSGTAATGLNHEGILLIGDSNVVIRNNLISGNTWGINILDLQLVSIKGNKVGTDVSGMNAIGNEHGIYLQSSSNLTVGGTGNSDGNLISGNLVNGSGEGIYTHFNNTITISGNKIGTDITGTTAIPNYHGIRIDDDVATIGGTSITSRNIISGNTYGIEVEGGGPTIQGNFIGTDITGTTAIANAVGIHFYSPNSVQPCKIISNLVSGNTSVGIVTYNSVAYYRISRNKIGVDFPGVNALPNGVGVALSYSTGAGMIGGSAASDANVISGNLDDGIQVINDHNFQDTIMNNKIGIDSSLTAMIPNETGINLAISASRNLIVSNAVAGNSSSGISISNNSDQNIIRQNSIYLNGDDGINCLGQENTFTHNAIGNNFNKGINNNSFGNAGIATPEILTATANTISGASLPNATIELFYSESMNQFPQGFTWIGSTDADISGNWSYSGVISTPCLVTSTQTDDNGNTSEFSSTLIQLIDLGEDSTVCEGNTYTLNADTGFVTYLWNTGDTTSFITVDTTGFYSVAVTNVAGCSDADTIYVVFTPCLHVNQDEVHEFSIYPNPAHEEIVIELNSEPVATSSATLIDHTGRIILSETLTGMQTTINTLHIARGIYLLQIETPDGVIARKKVAFQ